MKYLFAAAILAATVTSAQATTITFSGIAATAPLVTYSENGYTVTPITGSVNGDAVYGNPLPGLYIAGINPASFQVTRDAGDFTFASIDIDDDSFNTSAFGNFSLTGYLAGLQIFTQTGVKYGGSAGGFTTFANASPSSIIDRLVISQTSASGLGLDFDNIVVNTPVVTAAVPEAATWAMMMVGLGVVGGSLRRRRNVTTRVAFA